MKLLWTFPERARAPQRSGRPPCLLMIGVGQRAYARIRSARERAAPRAKTAGRNASRYSLAVR
jgi:hypothetical protein